jgi:hypothetical protein
MKYWNLIKIIRADLVKTATIFGTTMFIFTEHLPVMDGLSNTNYE